MKRTALRPYRRLEVARLCLELHSSSLKSAPELTIRNLQRAAKVDLAVLERFARRALDRCLALPKKKSSRLIDLANIEVLLISDRRMSELQQRFFQKKSPTDVITFQHGEIVISVGTAQRQARESGSSLLQEIQLYLVHGLLHLHGYDDKTRLGARLMQVTQKRILRETLKVRPLKPSKVA